MPLNLLKKHPEFLEILHLNEQDRQNSLRGIFKRDIEDNPSFLFKEKTIRPIKGEDYNLHALFSHLTCEEIQELNSDTGKNYPKRIFDSHRSIRLHWIKHYIDLNGIGNVQVFSTIERNDRKRIDVERTYLYDSEHKYVIVLEPQRSGKDYYLLTAYYLNKPEGKKTIEKKIKRKLADIL